MRFYSTFLTTALVSLMLSGCFFIPIPIGVVYPATPYQEPDGAVTSGAEANPSASLPDDKLAAKKIISRLPGKPKSGSIVSSKLKSSSPIQTGLHEGVHVRRALRADATRMVLA